MREPADPGCNVDPALVLGGFILVGLAFIPLLTMLTGQCGCACAEGCYCNCGCGKNCSCHKRFKEDRGYPYDTVE